MPIARTKGSGSAQGLTGNRVLAGFQVEHLGGRPDRMPRGHSHVDVDLHALAPFEAVRDIEGGDRASAGEDLPVVEGEQFAVDVEDVDLEQAGCDGSCLLVMKQTHAQRLLRGDAYCRQAARRRTRRRRGHWILPCRRGSRRDRHGRERGETEQSTARETTHGILRSARGQPPQRSLLHPLIASSRLETDHRIG
jgi:hypothetical protein